MSELTTEQTRWIEETLPKVRIIARSLSRQISVLAVEDLESAGHEALVRAAKRYDPETGVPFRAYAHYRIRGAMIDAVREYNPSIRAQHRAARKLALTAALLEDANRLAQASASLESRVAAARELVRKTSAAALLSRSVADSDVAVGTDPDPETALLSEERHSRLRVFVETLPAEDGALIDAIYRRGTSMSTLADELGVDKSTISRRHARIVATLAAKLVEV